MHSIELLNFYERFPLNSGVFYPPYFYDLRRKAFMESLNMGDDPVYNYTTPYGVLSPRTLSKLTFSGNEPTSNNLIILAILGILLFLIR